MCVRVLLCYNNANARQEYTLRWEFLGDLELLKFNRDVKAENYAWGLLFLSAVVKKIKRDQETRLGTL